jgi:hypothetical protein
MTGKLAKSLRQQIARGIDVLVAQRAALRTLPLPHCRCIEPQLIEYMLTVRASLARGIPAGHRLENLVVPLAERAGRSYVGSFRGASPKVTDDASIIRILGTRSNTVRNWDRARPGDGDVGRCRSSRFNQ